MWDIFAKSQKRAVNKNMDSHSHKFTLKWKEVFEMHFCFNGEHLGTDTHWSDRPPHEAVKEVHGKMGSSFRTLWKQNNRKSNLWCDSNPTEPKQKIQINRMVWTLRPYICIGHADSLRNTRSTSDVQRSPTVLGFRKNSTQPHLRLSCFQQTHSTWSGEVVPKAASFHWSSASTTHLRQDKSD